MPTSIPYDPSLTLMSVINETALQNVEKLAQTHSSIDDARDAVNSLLSSKRSLMMTKTELKNLGVGTEALDKELKKLDGALEKAATDYATAKMEAEPKIMELRKNMRAVPSGIESPVDYVRCEIKSLPLAADTINMDVQYIPFDSDSQSSDAYGAQVASFVTSSVSSVLGADHSAKFGTAASRQASRQVSSHNIDGTLVMSVSCTHKNASIVAPFVLHVDKAIKVWNRLFPGNKLDPTDKSSIMKCAMNESQEDKQHFSIISGTTYGSSFVGMVHVLKSTETSVSEDMQAATSSMQRTMEAGAWFANMSGRTGVDAKFASDVKNLLGQQNLQSHVAVMAMGAIPSIMANEVALSVDKFSRFDAKSNMEAVAGLQNKNLSEQPSISSIAEAARTGNHAPEMQGKAIESALSVLATIDDGNSKILNVDSMMRALDDYLKKAAQGDCGVPINYYLKDIDRKMLARMWAAKYYPGQFMSIKYDDAESGGPAEGQEKAKL